MNGKMAGMLWFDNEAGVSLQEKIKKALDYYRLKYQTKATLCYVHPTMMEDKEDITVEEVKVRANRSVMPNHFWIGHELEH